MVVLRVFASVLTDRLQESRVFWTELLGFEVAFDSNWFVRLQAPGEANCEIALVAREHETMPLGFQVPPGGTLITVIVSDVDQVYREAQRRGLTVLEAPTETFYGALRMLLISPAGQLVDVSELIDREPTFVDV